MNSLIGQEFFQLILNQFLVLDEDLIPWKLTCTDCFYHLHKIHIKSLQFEYGSMILDVVDPVEVNTSKHFDTEEDPDDSCCGVVYYHPNFDYRVFNATYFPNITHLTLSFTFTHLRDDDISCLTSLVYLDLGLYNSFTDAAIKPLKNLESLFLRNNHRITTSIFPHLPKLTTLQYDQASRFHVDDVPESVKIVMTSIYDKICEQCDVYDFEMGTKQVRYSSS